MAFGRKNFFSAKRIGKSVVRSTARQMIGAGKFADSAGDYMIGAGGAASTVGTITANPYLIGTGAALAGAGVATKLSGKALKSGGRIQRNTIIKGESLGEQQKHIAGLKQNLVDGIKAYESKGLA